MAFLKKIVLFSALFMINPIYAIDADKDFPVPDNLKSNIEFWKIIYTKISIKTGILHDKEYPLIIYDTLYVGDLYGRRLDSYTDQYKKKIAQSIKKIRSTKRSTWGVDERRLASLFRNYPVNVLKGAEKRIRFQLGQKERFLEGIIRSGALIDTICHILTTYNVPLRLAYLPHVESSFNIAAYSKAGAAGLWQFMPETGKQYLRINNTFDERLDPVLSTIAAARLLSKNYQYLKSWPLAITAYNYGLAGILRAVEKTGSRDLGIIMEKHESPTFRFASKNFYSCFIAASDIARNATHHFGKIEYSPKMTNITEVTLNAQLYPFEIGEMLGISEKEIAAMNPFILPNVFKEQRPLPGGTKLRVNSTLQLEKVEKQITLFFKSYPRSYDRLKRENLIRKNITEQTNYKLTISPKRTNLADSVFDLHLEWPEQRYVKFYNENFRYRSQSAFKIIIHDSSKAR